MKQETGTVIATALTWVRKATFRVLSDAERPTEYADEVAAYDAAALIRALLNMVELLVPLLDESDHEEYSDYAMIEKELRALSSDLKKRRLAEKLGNVEGRTPEEAAAFAAKAQSLKEVP